MYFFSGGKFGWSFWWSFWDIVGHRGIGTKFSWVGIMVGSTMGADKWRVCGR
jgi:hypothetical protein